MLMPALFEGRFPAYFRPAAKRQPLWVFVHVPKTAGSSLRAELARRLPPDANITIDHATAAEGGFHAQMDAAVEAFLAAAPEKGIRFASGHILGRHVKRIRTALPGTRFVTLLREPVARVVSDYRHQRSPRHPTHLDFAARVPTLEDYLALEGERDKAARHLIPPSILRGGDAEACLRHLLERYAFVGVQELYPLCFRALTALVDRPADPALRENVALEAEPPPEVTPELAARIRAANPIDTALHAAILARWDAIRERLARHLA